MAQDLQANTEVIVRIGSFVDVGDAFTPETGITLGAADEAELLKHNGVATVDISGNTWAPIANCDGWYNLTLTVTDTNTEGNLTVVVQDGSVCLPVHVRFNVLSQAAWASKYGAKDTGYMDVNVKMISEDTTAADNCEADYDGTGYAGGTIVKQGDVTKLGGVAQSATDLKDFADAGYDPATNKVEGVKLADTATAVTNDVGITQAGADKVWGTAARALTDKAGFSLSIAGIQAIWDKATSGLTTAGSIGKLIVDNINATISSRSSHTAANVWSVATRALTDKADFALSTAGIQAIWDKATSGLTTAGSIGKLLVDNINATISSRSSHAASAIWSVATRALTDKAGFTISGAKTTLDALNDITAASVWAVGTRTLTSFGTLTQDMWDKLTSALTTAGSIGKLLVDNIDAAITSRSSHGDPTAAIKGSPGKTNQEVYDHERGTDGAYTGTPPTVGQIADQIWDELQTGHVTAGSFGKYLDTEVSGVVGGGTPATIADAVWDELKAGHAVSGSFGVLLALEATLTAMKGSGFVTTEDSLRVIRQYIDQLESGEKPPSKANFTV